MIIKEIEISGVKVAFKSSAAVPRLYRAKFQRDVFKDFAKLEKAFKNKTEDGENIPIEDLELFENLAYIMALAADSTTYNGWYSAVYSSSGSTDNGGSSS